MTIQEMQEHAAEGGRFSDGSGIAYRFLGEYMIDDEDTIWTGYQQGTGLALVVMVGDDRRESIDPEYFEAIPEDGYCHECGQIGCKADGRERFEVRETMTGRVIWP